jgi:hypothetical protein
MRYAELNDIVYSAARRGNSYFESLGAKNLVAELHANWTPAGSLSPSIAYGMTPLGLSSNKLEHKSNTSRPTTSQ